ncbi:MAG TPA: hypothetical protein VFI96_05330 [Longimicrobiaceae bacterium]|nr:hypothetical protein [Longimicrobiaceae bacterium]
MRYGSDFGRGRRRGGGGYDEESRYGRERGGHGRRGYLTGRDMGPGLDEYYSGTYRGNGPVGRSPEPGGTVWPEGRRRRRPRRGYDQGWEG